MSSFSDSDRSFEHSDALKSAQDNINYSHPFGLKLWKPALYRKHRSIDAKTWAAFHSIPGEKHVQSFSLVAGNMAWTIVFGWWISLVYLAIAFCLIPIHLIALLLSKTGFPFNGLLKIKEYIHLLFQLSWYIFWPFGIFPLTKANLLQKRRTGMLTETLITLKLMRSVDSMSMGWGLGIIIMDWALGLMWRAIDSPKIS